MSDLYDFARERHDARAEADRLLLDGPDAPTRAESADDHVPTRPPVQWRGVPFELVVRARQGEKRKAAG